MIIISEIHNVTVVHYSRFGTSFCLFVCSRTPYGQVRVSSGLLTAVSRSNPEKPGRSLPLCPLGGFPALTLLIQLLLTRSCFTLCV